MSEHLKTIGIFAVSALMVIGFTILSGAWLLANPGQFVNGSDPNAPYDLIFQATVNNVYQIGGGFLSGSHWSYNFTIGQSLVNGKGGTGHWIATIETVPQKSIGLTLSCNRWAVGQVLEVMVTVKDGSIIYPNNQQIVQAVDPPQIVHADYSPWPGGGC